MPAIHVLMLQELSHRLREEEKSSHASAGHAADTIRMDDAMRERIAKAVREDAEKLPLVTTVKQEGK